MPLAPLEMNHTITTFVQSSNFVTASAPVIFCLDYPINSASGEVAVRDRGGNPPVFKAPLFTLCTLPAKNGMGLSTWALIFRVQNSPRPRGLTRPYGVTFSPPPHTHVQFTFSFNCAGQTVPSLHSLAGLREVLPHTRS